MREILVACAGISVKKLVGMDTFALTILAAPMLTFACVALAAAAAIQTGSLVLVLRPRA